ncbi:putative NADH-ubiquinone oxidoreductase 40 kDa subunit mitochondrial precursor [Ascobolus immersus RN42]|uniref:Putative NADH-ubiquinone oxidoreductase 40 kDa subunit mitochondrial n=1 Tax=Ascobolus immersus RN42 TaxID=1160509 RepID=A0A3N4IEA2_ASCIM|nr:putative NADH-ubiquinone oxidoreductase 40 kDa subunit mitochondrial precursor [Ascobolus immersus RN42]
MQRSCTTALAQSFKTAKVSGATPLFKPRYLNDIAITRTGKTILRKQGGRSSLGGHTVTVFGATGFLGRYIVNRLAKLGCTVVIPYREEMTKRHLKVTGDLGKVVFNEFDLRNTESIEESVRHSDVVFNLIGRDYPTKNFSYADIHVEGTQRITEAVAKYDVDRYIHVSCYNADLNSPSEYNRTKAQGEKEAREIFPETTIVRPAPMYGFEDRLLHRLAGNTNVLISNNMAETFYPVHVTDVAKGLEAIMYNDWTHSQTFELYGPDKFSMRDIQSLVEKEIMKERSHINIPKAILKPIANILNKAIWWPTISPDEVERQFLDQVIDPNALTFADLGIEPDAIYRYVIHYIRHYRSSSVYDMPPMTEKERMEEKKYLHVENDMA